MTVAKNLGEFWGNSPYTCVIVTKFNRYTELQQNQSDIPLSIFICESFLFIPIVLMTSINNYIWDGWYFFYCILILTLENLSVILIYCWYLKGRVHLQKIFLKYVLLRTVTKNTTIIITKYTWYHRYREIIQITWGLPLRLHLKTDLKAGRRKLKCSDVTSALSRLTQIILLVSRER